MSPAMSRTDTGVRIVNGVMHDYMEQEPMPVAPKIGYQEDKKEKKKPSTGLITAAEITDAADSDDLLTQMLDYNLDKIEEKSRRQYCKKRAKQEEKKIRDKYYSKAKGAYDTQWDSCREKSGHSFVTSDVRGDTVLLCDICGMAKNPNDPETREYSSRYDYTEEKVFEINKTLIQSLQKQMIKVDEETGLIEWPKPEDFEHETLPPPKPEYKIVRKFAWRGKIFPGWKEVKVSV